ncbi:MAG: ThiF family adenylyltransferase [Acidobacteriota bacterium]|nr:ThiF family adenylyltransferase [Acidobacteriota bacterium]
MNDDRYARHQLIPGWDQARLGEAQVIVVGIGALGNEVCRLLALSGVGRLLLCDPDHVETSNLSRTALFTAADLGRNKAEVARTRLQQLAPEIQLEVRPKPLVHGIGLAELRDADLVISCLDSRSARLQLAGRCNLVRAPLLDGGTHPWGGEVRPYLDPDGPCYGCSLTPGQRAVADDAVSCLNREVNRPVGASAAVSALIGARMSLIALRYLMGPSVPSASLVVDGLAGTTRQVSRTRDPECLLHQPVSEVRKLTVSHLDTLTALRLTLPGDAVPLLWENPQENPEASLELSDHPSDEPLKSLGIPPREILPVYHCEVISFVELCSPSD